MYLLFKNVTYFTWYSPENCVLEFWDFMNKFTVFVNLPDVTTRHGRIGTCLLRDTLNENNYDFRFTPANQKNNLKHPTRKPHHCDFQ